MAQDTRKPVLISGAGICALLFAQALKRASIPFVVFERDESMSFRAQGYRLRLSNEGLDAIEASLTPEAFKDFWETCSKTGRSGSGSGIINALTGEEMSPPADKPDEELSKDGKMSLTSRGDKVVGIARGEMRQHFLKGVEGHVRWGHNVTGYEKTPSGVRVLFADGSKSEEGSLLVGGEGIHSKVAKQLSGGKIKTFDTGGRGIHGQAPTTAFKGLGEGVWRIVDDSRPAGRVFAITNVRPGDMDDPNVMFGWTMGAQPGVVQVPNDDFSLIGKPAADIAKSLTANWHPRVKPLFDEINESEAAFWKITCSSPWGVPDWDNDQRVTVIGDAVHSMTPAGGNGANTAVRDSALLGRLVAEAGGWREGLTAEYEKAMRVYGSEEVAKSYGFAKSQFGVEISDYSPVV